MPEVIIAAKATFDAVVISAGASVGLSATTSVAIGNAALNLAVSAAIGAATTPSLPNPEGGKINTRQPRPTRRYAVGTCRVSGALMLFEADKNILHQVIAYPEGPVGAWGRTWLNDDEVTVTAGVIQQLDDKRYKTGLLLLEDRDGLETETAYADLVTEYGSVWTSLHRGDGIPSAWLRCQSGAKSVFNRTYPGGPPILTREPSYLAYDWRLDSTSGGSGAHRRNDPTTWGLSDNVVVWAVNILWRRYGQDWDRRFAPALDILTDEADVCDENVTLKAGGTVDRYKVGLWFEATAPIKTFLTAMLTAMDGHFSVRRDGAFIIRAGHYYAPTVIFGDAEIIDWTFDPGPAPDAVNNVLMCGFVDPAAGYSQVDCEPWRDEASITTHGERPADFAPQGVQSQSQVRRLAKAAMDRNMAASGTIRTPLSARRGLGERFIGIRCSEVDDLNDAVLEILDTRIELSSASIVWTYRLANSSRYAWTAAAEEGDPSSGQDRPDPVENPVPTITTVTPFFEELGTGVDGVRLNIIGTGPDRDDLTWFIQMRVAGATSWNVQEITDEDATADFEGDSGFVTANISLEIQLGYETAGGTLTWSTTTTVSTDVPVSQPAPTLFSASGTAGTVTVEVRAPVNPDVADIEFLTTAGPTFTSPTVRDTVAVTSLGAMISSDIALAGANYWWARAVHSDGTTYSTPVGGTLITEVMAPPTGFSASGTVGTVTVGCTAPVAPNISVIRYYTTTGATFTSPTLRATDSATSGAAVSEAIVKSGANYWWVVAETAAGLQSTAVGGTLITEVMSPPTGLSITGPPTRTIHWTTPNVANFHHCRLYWKSAAGDHLFAGSNLVPSGDMVNSPNTADSYYWSAGGSYDIWVVAYNADDTASAVSATYVTG